MLRILGVVINLFNPSFYDAANCFLAALLLFLESSVIWILGQPIY